MDDVKTLIQEITEAEAEAERLSAEALQEARRMNLEASNEALRLKEQARVAFKEEKKNIIAEAEATGEREYERIISLGESAANKLREQTDTRKAEELIAEAFIKRYGSR